MTKFLDYNGLSYFWEKIKALVLGKADKVQNATNGNFAGLDANGNLTDSGYKPSDFLTTSQLSEYTISDEATPTQGYQKTYKLKKNGADISGSDAINIPYTNAVLTVDNITALTSEQVDSLDLGDIVVSMGFAYIVGIKTNTYCDLLSTSNQQFTCVRYRSYDKGETWYYLTTIIENPPSASGLPDITNISQSQLTRATMGDVFFSGTTNKAYVVNYKSTTELSLVYVDTSTIEKVAYQKVNNTWTYSTTTTTSLSSIGDISNKADKVVGATSGNFAGLDSTGNLTDSGYSPSDLASQKVLICNYNGNTCDKTTQDIYDAKVAGKVVICIYNDEVYYLMGSIGSSCRFRAIQNQDSSMSFSYIKCLNGSWSMGSESWSSKANVSSTPQTTTVTDITALSHEQVTSLRLSDVVVLNDNGSYYTYYVSQKNGSIGKCVLVYTSYDKIEEVLYEKVYNVYSYIQTRQRQF